MVQISWGQMGGISECRVCGGRGEGTERERERVELADSLEKDVS